MKLRLGRLLPILLLAAAASLPPAGGEAAARTPQRIVSLNLCSDELLLLLAERERIASISRLAQDPDYSPATGLAEGLAVNHAAAEEVLRQKPDLVLASRFSPPFTLQLLRDAGLPVVLIEQPSSLADTRANIRRVAAAIGAPERGEGLIAEFDSKVAAARARADALPRERALVLQARGFTHGPGTVIHEILGLAGLINIAAERGYGPWRQMAVESVLRSAPEVVILEGQGDGGPSLAKELLRHPGLRRLKATTIELNERSWACGSPFLLRALDSLLEAREAAHG